VRIPIPVALLLYLCVIGGVWWAGTRDHDFLTPPSESGLAVIREKVSSTLPPADHPDEVVSEAPAPAENAPTPPPVKAPAASAPADSQNPPDLAEYRDLARKDPAAIIELAHQLETQGEFQRALLAWERIVDSAAADESQTRTAVNAIKRLRPTLPPWNADSAAALAIILHAGTGKTTAAVLTPVLEQVARELEQASSGILRISASVASGHDIPEAMGPAPIALWLAGSGGQAPSTEVIAFTSGPPGSLHAEVLKTTSQLLRGYLKRAATLTIPEAAEEEEAAPLEIMQSHITRLAWLELGSRLNAPPAQKQ